MGYMETYREWMRNPYFSDAARQELRSIENDPAEIEDRFYRNLSFGTPGMSATSRSALNIPGVQKGFVVPSLARQTEVNRSAVGAVFQPGDLIMHRKFGEGTVQAVTGTGADARIQIAFTAYGTKEFSLSIAPIVKID